MQHTSSVVRYRPRRPVASRSDGGDQPRVSVPPTPPDQATTSMAGPTTPRRARPVDRSVRDRADDLSGRSLRGPRTPPGPAATGRPSPCAHGALLLSSTRTWTRRHGPRPPPGADSQGGECHRDLLPDPRGARDSVGDGSSEEAGSTGVHHRPRVHAAPPRGTRPLTTVRSVETAPEAVPAAGQAAPATVSGPADPADRSARTARPRRLGSRLR